MKEYNQLYKVEADRNLSSRRAQTLETKVKIQTNRERYENVNK